MKKIKLLFMALLLQILFIGCDGSSSSSSSNDGGGSSYTGPDCPISATDFTWERIKIEKVTELVNSEVKDIIKYNYKINLKDNSKMEYINSGLVRWDAYNTYIEMGYTETNPQVFNEGLPTIIWNVYAPVKRDGSYDKKVVFYHNNKQCGEALILSPNNTQCDIPITDRESLTKIYNANQVPNIIITIDKSYSDNIKDIYLQFDNGFKMMKYNEKIEGDNKQYYFSGNLNQDTFEKYFKSSLYGSYFYLDVVVTKNDNSQCIKEILIRE